VGRLGKNAIGSIRRRISQKTALNAEKYRKNFLRKQSYSPFCFKFRCHGNCYGNEGRSEKKAIRSIRQRISENPLQAQKSRENLLRKLIYS